MEVSEKAVHITGFYPGSFPGGFSGGVSHADSTAMDSGEFSFDANVEKMYLTTTADRRIMEDKDYEG